MLHNIAVAEYFCNGCTDPQKLLDTLSKVKRRSEELSKNAGEQLDGIIVPLSSPSSAGAPGFKGNNSTSAGSAGSNSDAVVYMEDYDASIPTFNTAVILYHLQQFAAALSILEPLYQNIEPIDEPAALHICLLMLDITLASRQLRKAADVLQYMEKVFGMGFVVPPSESGSSVTPQSVLLSSASDSTSNIGNIPVSTANSTIPEASLTRSSSEEVLDEEVLSLGLDMEGSNSARSASTLSILSNATRVERPPSAPPKDSNVKILLHLYKVHLLLCTRNIKAAKREVKLAVNLARGRDYLTALILKAQLEYSRGNHRKAVKLLMTCSSREPGMRCIFLNNLGCIHHQLRKGHVACVYFLKALHSCASTTKEKPLKLSTFSQDKSLSIIYNCGLQQLRSGNPVLAARCFQEAGCLYYNRPLLWLRLAECCISALEKGLLEAGGGDLSVQKDELKVCSIGDGKWRKVVLPAGSLNPMVAGTDLGLNLEDADGGATSIGVLSPSEPDFFMPGKPHKLSLVFARHCLHNAAHLLKRLDVRAAEAAAEADTGELEEDDSQDSQNLSIQKSGTGNIAKGSIKGPLATGLQTNSNGNKETKGSSGTNTILTSVTAFEEEKQKENMSILHYVLADLAFVELCLENPIKALKSAEKLLQQPECTKALKFLGHMYAAEALCLLNRSRRAVDHLSTCLNESSNLDTPVNGADEDGQKWKSGENSEASADGDDGGSNAAGSSLLGHTLPEALSISSLTGTRARASLFVNLAMVFVMQGDLSQAHQLAMQAMSITPANPLAVLSVVYVELVQGRTQEAVALLKHCRHLCIISSKQD